LLGLLGVLSVLGVLGLLGLLHLLGLLGLLRVPGIFLHSPSCLEASQNKSRFPFIC